ncbi:MAG: hypothetical protein V7L21_13580 [Nostoc sp.]|uniref:hypothetical protein n=1 Tax=unclassified Nostoc TaxID=2593658 RepID=UPI0025EC2899|nr:hypothetical protein [Nostoc sp. NMS9]MBN3938690.1 hypothetical protein [Nostoc sp. NMS9]
MNCPYVIVTRCLIGIFSIIKNSDRNSAIGAIIQSDRPKQQIIVQALEISKGIVTYTTLQVNEVHPSST